MIKQGKVNILIDGQWGSTGKGKLAGWLHNRYPEINICVSDFMPNAGHTYVDNEGNSFMFKMLPMGTLFKHVKFNLIGPHAVINKEVLFKEIKIAKLYRNGNEPPVIIHPNAVVWKAEYLEQEQSNYKNIASTMQGCCEAQKAKMDRNWNKVTLACMDDDLVPFVGDTHQILIKHPCPTVLVETSQGFDLSLNVGRAWPYVTSRDCLIGRFLDNAGVHPSWLGTVIGSIRTYPIRVGNVEGGTSGPCYDDQKEMSWEEISLERGVETLEYTSVTKRIRRVFSFSIKQLYRFMTYCQPDYMFLNFVNYWSEKTRREKILFLKNKMMIINGCELKLLGTGAKNSEMEIL